MTDQNGSPSCVTILLSIALGIVAGLIIGVVLLSIAINH
jgi:hypothetical protein